MELLGKYVAEITREDVRELVHTHAAEDGFSDFKEVAFHPKHKKQNELINDFTASLSIIVISASPSSPRKVVLRTNNVIIQLAA
jgi:hypothetical protein